MILIECPTPYAGNLPVVFLAGGITGCPDWQAQAARALGDLPIAACNPRRANFPIHDPNASEEQILWEHTHLARADLVLFWFPDSGPVPQPIAMYELGYHAGAGSRIVVGTDPRFIRRADVHIQMRLSRPDIQVRDSLDQVCVDARRMLTATARTR